MICSRLWNVLRPSRQLGVGWWHSSAQSRNATWEPLSLLDDPQYLHKADVKAMKELQLDRDTAVPWNSPEYTKSRSNPVQQQLTDGRKSLPRPLRKQLRLLLPQVQADENVSLTVSQEQIAALMVEEFSEETIAKRDPNYVLLRWQRLWSYTRGPPSSLDLVHKLAAETEFSDFAPRSVAFLALVLSSSSSSATGLHESKVFFHRVRNAVLDSPTQYKADELACLAWSLDKVGLVDRRFIAVLEKALAGKTADLPWVGVCQMALVYRRHKSWFTAMHTDLYERYAAEGERMSATELLCCLISYRLGLDLAAFSKSDDAQRMLRQVMVKAGDCNVSELLGIFSLFTLDVYGVRRTEVPSVILDHLTDRVYKLSLRDCCSVFRGLAAIKSLDASSFVRRALTMYRAELLDLDTATMVQVCLTGAMHRSTVHAPLTHLFIRDTDELQLFAKGSVSNALDLWRLHTLCIAQDRICLPSSVAKLCSVQALKAAETAYHNLTAEHSIDRLPEAMAAGFNMARKYGRRALPEDVATNLILPTGHLIAAAMLFDRRWQVVSWDTYDADPVPWLSQDMKQVQENLSWESLEQKVKNYREDVARSGMQPYGLVLVEFASNLDMELEARILNTLGWRIRVTSFSNWQAAVHENDIQQLLHAKFFAGIHSTHKNAVSPPNTPLQDLKQWRRAQNRPPTLRPR